MIKLFLVFAVGFCFWITCGSMILICWYSPEPLSKLVHTLWIAAAGLLMLTTLIGYRAYEKCLSRLISRR